MTWLGRKLNGFCAHIRWNLWCFNIRKLWIDLEEARREIGAFVERYNRERLIERHGHRTPTEARQPLSDQAT